jgi:diguanylate cyclase (GGDEF)-like protein
MSRNEEHIPAGRIWRKAVKADRETGCHSALLRDLLESYRKLSNILNLRELYAAITDIIYARLAVRTLGLFHYDPGREQFELTYRHGLPEFELQIPRQDRPWWGAILSGDPFFISDGKKAPGVAEAVGSQDLAALKSDLWVPLVSRDEVIGLITLGHPSVDVFDGEACFFLKEIASHAAVCMHTTQLYLKHQKEKEDLDKTLQNLSLLYNIGKAMNFIGDLKKLLQYILTQAIEIAGAEKGSLMLYDMESDRLDIRVLAGLEDNEYQDRVNNNEIICRSFKPGEGIAGRVFLSGKPIVVNNTNEETLFIGSESSFVRSIACIPMIVYSDVIGVINVTNKRDGRLFSDEDVEMLRAVADQAAVAVNKAQLWDMAVTDSLTGLYVRRYFLRKLQEEIVRAERYGKYLSVIMADLDRFKHINDRFGHDAGDRVLKSLGHFFQASVRDVDVIARYGGEEFVILLPDADKQAAFALAERLRESLGQLRLEELPRITMSLGVATFPEDGTEIEALVKKADIAMYAAKQAGRNRTVGYDGPVKLVREENR